MASVDGMRFVVPVPSGYARPNPKYFGRRGGATWLNMINDQAAGLGGKVVAGTPRDSLYVLDVLYDRDSGRRPEMIVTDTASYSDIVFGLLPLAGFAYAPQFADLPDQKMWRIDRTAEYGAFQDAARGRVDLARIERHWEDILRIIGSIHTGAVRAYDVIRMLSRDGRPTPLGDAIAHYGRIAKTLHILHLADEPGYRRQIKVQANLQEGRHALARKIFHRRAGQLYQRYQDGMEDQIGALGLVLNSLVLFNTRYMDAAVNQLRADGFDVRDEDAARHFRRSSATTSTCWAGTPSNSPTCPAACARCAPRTPSTSDRPPGRRPQRPLRGAASVLLPAAGQVSRVAARPARTHGAGRADNEGPMPAAEPLARQIGGRPEAPLSPRTRRLRVCAGVHQLLAPVLQPNLHGQGERSRQKAQCSGYHGASSPGSGCNENDDDDGNQPVPAGRSQALEIVGDCTCHGTSPFFV